MAFQRDIYQFIHLNSIDYIMNIDETAVNYAMPQKRTIEARGAREVLLRSTNQENKRVAVVLGVVTPVKSNITSYTRTNR